MEPDVAAAFAAQLEHNKVEEKTLNAIMDVVKIIADLQQAVDSLTERVRVLEGKAGG